MFKNIVLSIKRFVTNLKNRIKQRSRPTTCGGYFCHPRYPRGTL